jgi:hypothetical protein
MGEYAWVCGKMLTRAQTDFGMLAGALGSIDPHTQRNA